MTAFSLAPYPSLAGRPNSQLYFGLHPQGFAVSSASRATSAFRHHRFDAVRSRFCARARALALHPWGMSVCPVVGGLSTPAISASGSRPSSLAGCDSRSAAYNLFGPTTFASKSLMQLNLKTIYKIINNNFIII